MNARSVNYFHKFLKRVSKRFPIWALAKTVNVWSMLIAHRLLTTEMDQTMSQDFHHIFCFGSSSASRARRSSWASRENQGLPSRDPLPSTCRCQAGKLNGIGMLKPQISMVSMEMRMEPTFLKKLEQLHVGLVVSRCIEDLNPCLAKNVYGGQVIWNSSRERDGNRSVSTTLEW